jgi:hypothetical protein
MLKSIPSLVLLIPLASAEAFEDISSKIKLESEAAARNVAPKISEYFSGTRNSEINEITGYSPNTLIPGKDMNLEQAEGIGHSRRQQEYEKQKDYNCSKENCEVGHTFSTHATLERQVKAEITGFIKDENGEVKNNKGYMDKALETVRNSKKNFDFLKGEYVDCEAGKDTTTFTTEENCDQYFDIKKDGCFASQVVEIDPKYTYVCNKTRDLKEKLCTDALKELKCQKTNECDGGGIVLGSVDTGMEWHYDPGNSTLRLGSLGTYYWNCGDSCQKISRSAKFKIKNKPAIKAFRLKKLFLNNLLQVSVNGSVVYNSLGGNKLEISSWRGSSSLIDAGLGKGGHCLINAGRKIPDYVSIDLIPHLVEGQNEIVLELIYSFFGHIHIEIEARQHCCAEWAEERDEQCEYL